MVVITITIIVYYYYYYYYFVLYNRGHTYNDYCTNSDMQT